MKEADEFRRKIAELRALEATVIQKLRENYSREDLIAMSCAELSKEDLAAMACEGWSANEMRCFLSEQGEEHSDG